VAGTLLATLRDPGLEERGMANHATWVAEAAAEGSEGTTDLIREALDQTRELVRLEVAMAREEAKSELGRVKRAGLALAGAFATAVVAVSLLLVALALATDAPWWVALGVGGGLLMVAITLAVAGWKMVPRRPLANAQERLETDWTQLKDRIA
jgi:hypothetical protein